MRWDFSCVLINFNIILIRFESSPFAAIGRVVVVDSSSFKRFLCVERSICVCTVFCVVGVVSFSLCINQFLSIDRVFLRSFVRPCLRICNNNTKHNGGRQTKNSSNVICFCCCRFPCHLSSSPVIIIVCARTLSCSSLSTSTSAVFLFVLRVLFTTTAAKITTITQHKKQQEQQICYGQQTRKHNLQLLQLFFLNFDNHNLQLLLFFNLLTSASSSSWRIWDCRSVAFLKLTQASFVIYIFLWEKTTFCMILHLAFLVLLLLWCFLSNTRADFLHVKYPTNRDWSCRASWIEAVWCAAALEFVFRA